MHNKGVTLLVSCRGYRSTPTFCGSSTILGVCNLKHTPILSSRLATVLTFWHRVNNFPKVTHENYFQYLVFSSENVDKLNNILRNESISCFLKFDNKKTI